MATQLEIIEKAKIQNAAALIEAARIVGLPLHVAVAITTMESNGRNYFGSDSGGTFEDGGTVTEARFRDFWKRVNAGARSNGVGPMQITYAGTMKNGKRVGGFFNQAEKEGYRLWVPIDNYQFGFKLIKSYYAQLKKWDLVGIAYNDGLSQARKKGANTQYGRTFLRRVAEWENRLEDAEEEVVYVPKTWRIEDYDPDKPDSVPDEHGEEEVPEEVAEDGDVS